VHGSSFPLEWEGGAVVAPLGDANCQGAAGSTSGSGTSSSFGVLDGSSTGAANCIGALGDANCQGAAGSGTSIGSSNCVAALGDANCQGSTGGDTPIGSGNCVAPLGDANCDNQAPGCTGDDYNPVTNNPGTPNTPGGPGNNPGNPGSGVGAVHDGGNGASSVRGSDGSGVDAAHTPGVSAITVSFPKAPEAGSGMTGSASDNANWFILAAMLLLVSGAAGLAGAHVCKQR
jgi:hypothetical protein